MGDFVYNSNEFDYMLTTEGRVIPEMGIIMHYNCFYNMKERSCKLRSGGGLAMKKTNITKKAIFIPVLFSNCL